MSTHQQSKPRRANQSMTEESGRPSTCKSKVGCDAMDEPCTNRMVPSALFGSTADFSNMNSFTLSSLPVQCSWPRIATGLVTSFMVVLPEKLRRESNMRVWQTRPRCRLHKSPCERDDRGRLKCGRYTPPALRVFARCAKGRRNRPAARIRLILGQIGAHPLHLG